MQLHSRSNLGEVPPDSHQQHVFESKRYPNPITVDHDDVDSNCNAAPADRTDMHLRIASIFIILVSSLIGALLPILLRKFAKGGFAKAMLFGSKFVGSGVIISTAWMHLMAPAAAELGHECARRRLGRFDWAFFIALMTVMSMFLAEILVTHFGHRGSNNASSASRVFLLPEEAYSHLEQQHVRGNGRDRTNNADNPSSQHCQDDGGSSPAESERTIVATQGDPHKKSAEDHPGLVSQLTAVSILEFGIVFHSVLIGLVLATTSNLTVLLIAMVFHQLLEGLGLGARLADAPWPRNRWWLPYMCACLFAVSTPIGTVVGLVAQPRSAADQLLITGIFDAISAGILMYTGLVELLAHEFLLNPEMRSSPLRAQLSAFACILAGTGGMALLANWA
ncbi:Zinc/iron permease [Sodiomyces alkalinus F11]|uniref:Zinc/iron permease n=1 Tax=Sodiomyces alkalinus (strain CBS 110278 / VKM F-3762 / F11) TaxID=1314773 RepID=A0A3N2Q5L4_SODAK|nr:Zinc/iron permease [Sodiomyces alkalinus F11]ROT42042.1 Zinc/iron permease [Sodiomyces alkalinus F11]